MFIKNFDFLSPQITFYYKGYLSHSSIVSGIFSIIAVILIINIAVYFSLDIIRKNNPNAYFFNTFTKDAGSFQVNQSSLFHFTSIIRYERGKLINEKFDFTLLNIVGAQMYISNYLQEEKNKKLYSHWLYGYCDKKVNTKDLDDLINYDFFEISACIKKYYNPKNQQYYEIGEPGFVFPSIEHGAFNDLNKLYGIFVQKCDNETIKKAFGNDFQCKSDEEIDAYLKGGRIMNFYFIDKYINVLDYYKPNNKFIYKIENPLQKTHYSSNDIHINPVLLRSHNGVILDRIKEYISYAFDRNNEYIKETNGVNMHMSYCFILKNNKVIYERAYKKIQEVISSIGGINQAITIFAIMLNNLYYNFEILSDTEMLLNSLIHVEKKNNRKSIINNKYLNQKIKGLQKINKQKESHRNIDLKKSTSKATINDKSIFNFDETNHDYKNISEVKTKVEKELERKKNLAIINTFTNRNIKEKTFINYIIYKISCGTKKIFYKYYQDFRIKLISEEHLIRNHLNIYHLLKIAEKKRHFRRSSYRLEELINFV